MADYYVSPTGLDTNNGSIASPFLTITKGLNKTVAGDRLILRQGIHRGNAGWFPANATAGGRISIEAYPGESVTISALSVITNWEPFDLTNGKAIYRAAMPFTMCGASSAVAGEDFVTCNGIPINEAQWPPANPSNYPQKAADWATVDSGSWTTSATVKNTVVTAEILDAALTIFPDNSLVGSRITLLPGARWTLVSGTVSANVGNKLTFSLKSPGAEVYYTPDSRSLYFLFGKSVLLNSPGSWWRDPDTNFLYLWLPDSSNPNNSVIEAKKDAKILEFHSRSHYTLKNLNFVGSRLSINSASDMKFHGCTFKWYSHRLYHDTVWGWVEPAFYINRDRTEFIDCNFTDSFGLMIVPEAQQGLTVKNCVLSNTGGTNFGGVNSKFFQNTVTDCPGGCFKLIGSVAGTEISYNDFGKAGKTFTDGGVFLIARLCAGQGRIFRNFLHDGYAPLDHSKHFFGTGGIYFEADISNLIFDHNIICRTTSPGFNLVANGGGKKIENVKFYNNTCDAHVYWIPTWAENPTFPGVDFYNNYFIQQAPNTGYHPDLEFSRNAFKTLPSFLNATNNISVPDHTFANDYSLPSDSLLKAVGQVIAEITTDAPPDIGAREGIPWTPGAVVRTIDVPLLTLAAYQVDGNFVIFSLGNVPFGRRLGDDFKMKLGSGAEAVGTIVPYSPTTGGTVWARVGTENWQAIGTIGLLPILSSLSTDSGLAGSVVSLFGSNFQANSYVLFGDLQLVVNYINAESLELTIPADAVPSTQPIRVFNFDGQGTDAFNYSVLSSVSLTGISSTVVIPGQQIQLMGTGFVSTAIARFASGIETPTGFIDTTSLTIQIPILPAGDTAVKVVNPNGTESGTLPITVVLLPAIANFDPDPIQPGQPFTITGQSFGADPYVSFAGTEVIPTTYSGTVLQAIAPPSISAGNAQVSVVSEVGSSAAIYVTVLRAPVLSTVTPTKAIVGARVLLAGLDLTVGSQIFFGSTIGVQPIFSGTSATVEIPQIPLGSIQIKVVSSDSLESQALSFEIVPQPPVLLSIPEIVVAGETVSIIGENFLTGVSVVINEIEIISGVSRLSETEIGLIVPSLLHGTYSLSVTNLDGGISQSLNFSVRSRPTVSILSLAKGLVGTAVTVTGTNFEIGTAIRLGTIEQVALVQNSSTLSFEIPTTAPGIFNLSVRNATGLESSTVVFEVLGVPKIESVNPIATVPGTEVIVAGSNFKPDAKVYLNEQLISAVRESSTSLKFIAPALTFGIFALKVVNAADELSSTPTAFTVSKKPNILSISPTSAQPGATVKIFGTDFESPTVLLNGSQVESTNANSALSFVVPQFPPSTLSLRVRNQSNVLSEPAILNVLPQILLYSSVPPTATPKATVALQGNFFPPDARVFFGSTESQVIAVAGDRITVQVPVLPPIPTTIKVVTPAGAVSTSILPFDVLPSLTISQIIPNPAPSGTVVEIQGSGFDEGVAAFVRDARAIDLIRISDTLLKITVPPLVPGFAQFKLVLPDDRQTFFDFTVPSVWISGVSHTVVQVGEWLEIAGTGFVQPLTVTVGGVAVTEVVVSSPTLIKVRVPAFLLNEV